VSLLAAAAQMADRAANGMSPIAARRNKLSPSENCLSMMSFVAANGAMFPTNTSRQKMTSEGTISPTTNGVTTQI
jgi:hypothetical protein